MDTGDMILVANPDHIHVAGWPPMVLAKTAAEIAEDLERLPRKELLKLLKKAIKRGAITPNVDLKKMPKEGLVQGVMLSLLSLGFLIDVTPRGLTH